MCKVVGFTNASKLNVKKASEKIGALLLESEKDGYGYAVQGLNGVYGEKCIAPIFKSRLDNANIVNLPIVEHRQSTFGVVDKPVGPAIFHGRTSTNDKGLLNCHPMQRSNWHLIHNGVVTDNGPKYIKHTTNDSEDLLHRLTLGIEHVERELSGYYAFCAIDPQGRLHVARDSSASLYMAWCPGIQSMIFATTYDLIENIALELKLKMGPIDKMRENVYCIFQGNDLVHQQSIRPRGFDAYEASLATKSLGRELELVQGLEPESAAYAGYNKIDKVESDFQDLLRELDYINDTYTIYGPDAHAISAAEFRQLDDVSKFQCYIERPDGSVIELYDYNVESPVGLYKGD